MENPYIKILKTFNPFIDDLGNEINENELPLLVQNILRDIRQEKKLTYVDAYAALEVVYKFLRRESTFGLLTDMRRAIYKALGQKN